ncbi:hypothetical protein BKA93DRAFT_759516 [Sparassis latifolia]|uniref:ZZ-type domain-containing protein n=1 Tax=Sparassis crispa TaxID=139825 RepID=A0A401H5F5_9APHY|nr:predicted protein [Sparassis crispa]GBE89623.1 predicted protein [Sparassis crispa]
MSSEYGSSDIDWTETRPDKALVVKCSYEGLNKRITFNSARTCSYDFLRQRVEECFSLSATSYAITYTDDDGEVTDISTESDLTEAIRYFHPANEEPISSAASILSGRSFNKGKITVRVRITVEYDGPSLSDTSSLVSLDEYRNRNGSDFSLSFTSPPPAEIDDDSVTISSKDLGSKYELYRARGAKTIVSAPSQEPLIARPARPPDDWEASSVPSIAPTLDLGDVQSARSSLANPFLDDDSPPEDSGHRDDPSSVFQRLKLEDTRQASSSHSSSTLHSERGAAWLRDQNARAVKAMLGDVPSRPLSYSGADSADMLDDASSAMGGELALQQDSSGKYYFAYTAGSSAGSQSAHDSGYDDRSSVYDDLGTSVAGSDEVVQSRPVSMEVNVFDLQGAASGETSDLHRCASSASTSSSSSSSSVSNPFTRRSNSEPTFTQDFVHPDVPHDVLPYITTVPPVPPQDPPSCSECGVILDAIRYVCSKCGEKKPPGAQENGGKGKDREVYVERSHNHSSHAHSPSLSPLQRATSPSLSSWSVVTGSDIPLRPLGDNAPWKPLPAIPSPKYLAVTPESMPSTPKETGYELCWGCIESAGVTHALEMSVAPGSSPGSGDWPSSPEDAQRALSQWRRSAPSQKGQLRHAFIEKSWGHKGWQDVEQDEHRSCTCSGCSTVIVNHRFKCASCKNFNLCRACYSQVHEIHPSHAFLVVPDKAVRARSVPVISITPSLPTCELSMTHPGVKCVHCMQDIVGARFHCAICEAIDICSNCESAGLPGNLDSSDGGHNSSHIMIKIPYPLGTAELQSASRTAKSLWTGRDAATGQRVTSRERRNSLISSYDGTVLGSSTRIGITSALDDVSVTSETDDHGIRCNGCNQNIVGNRYQCAECPSIPRPYNLCSLCEERSYIVHDPMHIFFKFPRPVDRPLQSEYPFIPRLYKAPVGSLSPFNRDDPKAYLKDLFHNSLLCDCCMMKIQGAWYRCAYCGRDLCEVCQEIDTHDNAHAFVVFKSSVDMHMFKRFAELGNDPNGPSPPIIPYPIYHP